MSRIVEDIENEVAKLPVHLQPIIRDIAYCTYIKNNLKVPGINSFKCWTNWDQWVKTIPGKNLIDRLQIDGSLQSYHKDVIRRLKTNNRIDLDQWFIEQTDTTTTTDLIKGDKPLNRDEEIAKLVMQGNPNQIWKEGDDYRVIFKFNPNLVSAVKSINCISFWNVDKRWWELKIQHNQWENNFTESVKRFSSQYNFTLHRDLAFEWFGNAKSVEASLASEADYHVDGMLLEPYPYQKAGIRYGVDKERVLIGDDTGLGKELHNDTPILTKNGWIAIKDIQVNDSVYGKDGNLHTVIGVYPQGVKPLYKVTFIDRTFVEAGLDHQWSVKSKNDNRRNRPWRTVNTKFLIGNLKYEKSNSYTWDIPLCDPINYPKQELPIDPYILGVLIADGSLTYGSPHFVPGDKRMPEIMRKLIPEEYEIRKNADYGTSTRYYICKKVKRGTNLFIDYLRKCKLNVTGEHKFIPHEYLHANIDQRKSLLAGLLDSDGTVSGSRTRYSTSSIKLANDVVTLVQSLGGMAVISTVKGRTRIRDGRVSVERDNYHISVRVSFNPFIKESNVVKWRISNHLIKSIISVEYSRDAEATCIAVDAPDRLYITKDHIVTHNTPQAIGIVLQKRAFPCLVVCPKSVMYMWKNAWMKFTGLNAIMFNQFTGTEQIVIVNYEQAKKMIVHKDHFISFIGDESHKLKSKETAAFKNCFALAANKRVRILLTATAIMNEPRDLISQAKVLGYLRGEAEKKFIARYCPSKDKPQNLQELQIKIRSLFFIKRYKSEVMKELPAKTRSYIDCELSNQKEYDDAERDLVSYLRDTANYDNKRLKKVAANEVLLRVGILKKISALGKIRDACEFIQNLIEDGEKVVVFAYHHEVMDAIAEIFDCKDMMITGKVNDPLKRQNIIDAFVNDPNKKIIIMNLMAGSVGIDGLQYASNNTVIVEQWWNYAIHDQLEGRTDRNGQKSPTFMHYFLGQNTIDQHINRIIETKRDISNQALGSEEEQKKVSKSVYKDLMQEVFKLNPESTI